MFKIAPTGLFYEAEGAAVNRISDRLFVGHAVLQNGNLNLPPTAENAGDWLDTYQAEFGLEPIASATLASLTDGPGQIGVLGGARGTNNIVAGQSIIGVAGYAYNNSPTLPNGGWSYYGESYKASVVNSNSYGAELAVVNQSAVGIQLTPYSGGGCIGIQLDSGNGYNAAAQPGLTSASAAITISQNTTDGSAPWLRGIVVFDNSITDDGGVHEAMALPAGYGIRWYNSSNQAVSFVSGQTTSVTGAVGILFGDDGMEVMGATTGATVAVFGAVPASVNYVNIQGSPSGGGPNITGQGGDANVSLVLGGKGSGVVLCATHVFPSADGTFDIGSSTNRWSSVWAANGSIQTSDPTLKTAIAPLPAALPIINAINPITFKWKNGGTKAVAKQVEVEEDVFEDIDVPVEEPELHPDGSYRLAKKTITKRRRMFDTVPVMDANGKPVIDMVTKQKGGKHFQIPVPRTTQVHRKRKVMTTQFDMVDQPGQRTHWGFSAADIKAAIPQGMDWAAYVKAEDGSEHLRPDQLIPVLWKAVQELAAEVAALKGKRK